MIFFLEIFHLMEEISVKRLAIQECNLILKLGDYIDSIDLTNKRKNLEDELATLSKELTGKKEGLFKTEFPNAPHIPSNLR